MAYGLARPRTTNIVEYQSTFKFSYTYTPFPKDCLLPIGECSMYKGLALLCFEKLSIQDSTDIDLDSQALVAMSRDYMLPKPLREINNSMDQFGI